MAESLTPWADRVKELEKELDDRAFRRTQGYSVAGRSVQYRPLKEILELLALARREAAIESGQAFNRTYALNAGRG